MKRIILKVIYALCVSFLGAIVCLFTFDGIIVQAESENKVTINCNQKVTKGNTYYGYVYIESLENIASLNVSIHYDSDVVSITNTYNQVSCALYDNSNINSALSYSYIFNAGGTNSKINLFYFTYTISENTDLSSSLFDVVIDEAYNFSLENENVSGSRYYFEIIDRQQSTKTCYVYGSASVSTKIEEEFEIIYRLSSYEIAAGSVEIQYDHDLFEFISLTQLGFLVNKMVDVNSSIPGSVFVSFLGTEYSYDTDFLRLKFKSNGNEDTNSIIKLVTSGFYDSELNNILCNGTSTNVILSYDGNYDESLSKIFLTSNYDLISSQVKVLVNLSANSNLGAGDFILSWSNNYYEYVSFEKKFNPSFFNVNDKLTEDGILKFSIISLTDITSSAEVIEVTLNVITQHDETISVFDISGNGIADSLTNPINLNYVNCNQVISGNCFYGEWTITKEPTCTDKGEEHRICSVCGAEETREVAAKGHSWEAEWTIDVEATCEHPGSKSHHCTRCEEVSDVTEIEKVAHQGKPVVRENEVDPTCTEAGGYDEVVYCANCNLELSREHKTIEALGHSYGGWITTKEATCTESGSEHRICSVCSHEEIREIPKLDSRILFINTINSIDLNNDSFEQLYSKLVLSNEYYQYIEDKESVSSYYLQYQNVLSHYQSIVSSINSEYNAAKSIENNYFITIIDKMNYLTFAVYVTLKGKWWIL